MKIKSDANNGFIYAFMLIAQLKDVKKISFCGLD